MKSSTIIIQHKFVDHVPEELEDGILYISIPFATAIHRCPCGCKTEVVTPFSPKDWELAFDGETVSLYPSVGNWSLPCRSHYFIRRNSVRWAGDWSAERIAKAAKRDQKSKNKYYNGKK